MHSGDKIHILRGILGIHHETVCKGRHITRNTAASGLILLFASLFTATLARQSFLHALLLAGLQVVGMTFNFFNDVFLLNLTLKPAEGIL